MHTSQTGTAITFPFIIGDTAPPTTTVEVAATDTHDNDVVSQWEWLPAVTADDGTAAAVRFVTSEPHPLP